jgi:hypothetical protein
MAFEHDVAVAAGSSTAAHKAQQSWRATANADQSESASHLILREN